MNDSSAPRALSPDQAALVRACVFAAQLGIVAPEVAAEAAQHARIGALPGPASASFVLGIDVELVAALVTLAGAAPGEDAIAETAKAGLLGPTEPHRGRRSSDGDNGPSFDRYEVRGEIGRGGMGLVLAGHDPSTRRLVAIKVLKPGLSRAAALKFLDEGQVTAQLEHPNIVPVHEIGQTREGQAYFAMKKVQGQTLAQLIHHVATRHVPAPPLNRWLDVFAKLCDGVAYAHSRGVIHRDLKPMNAMLGEFGEVLILDWGIAKQLGRPDVTQPIEVARADSGSPYDHTREGDALGTLAYMPPEQARGEQQTIDERADVYALGAILYEMLTHEQAFTAPTYAALLAKVLAGNLVPPSRTRRGAGVPREIEAVVLRAMAPRREDRYPSVAALKADVEAFCEGRLLAAAQYTPLQLALRWAHRHRAALRPAVAAALVLAGAAAWNLTRPGALAITAVPVGTLVCVDGRPPEAAGADPLRVILPAGRHRVAATLEGHDPVELEVALERRETRELGLVLKRQTGTLDLETEPAGALAWIDGQAHGTPIRGLVLATGTYQATVQLAGRYRESLRFHVAPRQRASVYAGLAPAVGWKRRQAEACESVPIGDFDGDGVSELLHWMYWTRLEIINGATGAIVLERQLFVEAETLGWTADTDGDGVLELITGLRVPAGGTQLVAIDLVRGATRWSTAALPILTIAETGGAARPAPVLERGPDLDHDGVGDVLAVLAGPRLAAYSGKLGALIWEATLPSAGARWLDAGDLSGDDRGDLLIVDGSTLLAVDGTTGRQLWSLPLEQPATVLAAIEGGAGWVLGEEGALGIVDRNGRSRGKHAAPGYRPGGASWVERAGDALVLVAAREGRLAAWDLRSGAALWNRAIEGTDFSRATGAGGTVLLVHRDEGGAAVVGTRLADGAPAWRVECPAQSRQVDALDLGDTPSVLVAAGDQLLCLEPASGTVTWRWRAPGTISARVVRGVADPSALLVGTAEGHVCWLGLDGIQRASAQIDLPADSLRPMHLDGDGLEDVLVDSQAGTTALRGRRILWQRDLGNALRAPPVVVPREDGGVDLLLPLPGRGRGEAVARLDGRTGQTRWETHFPHNMIRPGAVTDLGAGPVGLAWKLPGTIAVLDLADGRMASEIPVGAHGYAEPVAADLDGDGVPDVLAMAWFDDGIVVATNGKTRTRLWERRIGAGAMYGPVVAAVDGSPATTVYVAANGGQVVAINGSTGAVRWSANTHAANRAGVAVGTIAPGSAPVAVVATQDGRLAVFDARTGTVVRVLSGVGCGASRPTLVDVDGDGAVEIVLGTSTGLLCLTAEGRVIWRAGPAAVSAASVVCDLDGDGAREVLFGTTAGELVCAQLATGAVRWRWGTGAGMPIESECAVADLNGDAILDVVVAGHDRTLSALSGR